MGSDIFGRTQPLRIGYKAEKVRLQRCLMPPLARSLKVFNEGVWLDPRWLLANITLIYASYPGKHIQVICIRLRQNSSSARRHPTLSKRRKERSALRKLMEFYPPPGKPSFQDGTGKTAALTRGGFPASVLWAHSAQNSASSFQRTDNTLATSIPSTSPAKSKLWLSQAED